METLMALAIALYSANAVFFGGLAIIYGRTAISTKAKYPFGLLVFSVLLLVQSAGTALAYLTLSPYFLDEAVPSMLAMAGFEFVGVIVLAKTTF